MAQARQLLESAKETLGKLSRTQRFVLVGVTGLIFLSLLLVALFSSRGTEYDILWSDLSPQDAGAIVKELEKEGVPYKLEAGGTVIKVPKDSVYRLRLTFASMGLPASGVVGFESISANQLWSTDFERQVQYTRALQGEIVRTIKSMDPVEDARVHIVLPEPSVFVTQQKPATAAVMLKLRPMEELTKAQVKAIVNLVSSSVQGLSPENVTVVDSTGRLLSQDISGGGLEEGFSSLDSLEVTYQFERNLEKRLTNLLNPILGPGNVVCQVRAELNLDLVKRETVTYAQDPILRSTQEIQETFEGSGTPSGGPAGGLDVPSYVTPSSEESRYQRTETINNYEVSEVREATTVAPGTVKRLSVAVVLNRAEMDEDFRESIVQTVRMALGLDDARQDQISVINMPFSPGPFEEETAPAPVPIWQRRYFIYGAAVAAALLAGTIVLLLLRRRRLAKGKEMGVEEGLVPEAAPVEAAPAATPEMMALQRAREGVERLARTNPELVARMLRTWLVEDER